MTRVPVSSSNVASVGYDSTTGTLEVEFLGGQIYQYFDVPVSLFEGMIAASSVGSYLNQNIKGSFRYARV